MSIIVSIIMGCPNGRIPHVIRGINSICYQGFNKKEVELLFLNDAGEYELLEILKTYSKILKIRYFFLKRRQSTKNRSCDIRNFLIRQSEGKYIIITDPEMVHFSETINQTFNAFSKYGDKIWYCGKVYGTKSFTNKSGVYTNLTTRKIFQRELNYIGPEPLINNRINLEYLKKCKAYHYINPKKIEVFMYCTAVAKRYLEKVKGFNENMRVWGYEDVDIYYRLKNIGIKRIFDGNHIVYHLPHQIRLPLEQRLSWNLYNTFTEFNNGNEWGKLSGELIKEYKL